MKVLLLLKDKTVPRASMAYFIIAIIGRHRFHQFKNEDNGLFRLLGLDVLGVTSSSSSSPTGGGITDANET